MAKNIDSTETHLLDSFGTGITQAYIILMFIFFPVFYRGGTVLYLIQDKHSFFFGFTGLYLICMCPAVLYHLILFFKNRSWKNIKKENISPDMVFTFLLLLAIMISTITALDPKAATTGLSYRAVAADFFTACILVYFCSRQFGKYTSLVLWSWLIGSVLIYLFGIFCGCGINFLHMQDGISNITVILTPLGNTNFNASYVCLVLPLVLVMHMICREKFSKNIYAFAAYMGFLFVFMIRTESSLISALAAMGMLFFFALEQEQWSARFLEMSAVFLLAMTTLVLVLKFLPGRLYPFDGVDSLLLSPLPAGILWALYFTVFLLWRRKGDKLREDILRYRKRILCGVAALFAAGGAAVVLANIFWREQLMGTAFQAVLLTDATFSGRGIIWKQTVKMLGQSPPLRLLFGYGLNCYSDLMAPGALPGQLTTDPHNELMQALSEMGILGAVGYFGLLFSTLSRAWKKWRENEFLIVTILSVSIYLIQGLVNCYAIFHFPILFIFLGLANGSMQDLKEEEPGAERISGIKRI